MPRWKDLPDELDPQVREFTSQLRQLVDRGGLNVASVADRTGYSKTSWERYLNGRLLAPKGAVVALAEVTGVNPGHLTTMWELAERAWSRSEMRQDSMSQALRMSRARSGEPAADGDGDRVTFRKAGGPAAPRPGVAGPAGVSPTVPPRPAESREPRDRDPDSGTGAVPRQGATDSGGNSWGLAGYRGPSPSGRPGAGARPRPGAPGDGTPANGTHAGTGSGWPSPSSSTTAVPGLSRTTAIPAVPGAPGALGAPGATKAPGAPVAPGDPVPPAARPPAPRGGGEGRRRLTMFLAGFVGALALIGGVFYLTGGPGGSGGAGGGASASPTADVRADLPPGVKCAGASCTGKDAEGMGCTKDAAAVTTPKSAIVGNVYVEVRYSETCRAAWGRITQAVPGDRVEITAGRAKQSDAITADSGDTIAYTPMVAVKDAQQAVACATLATGQQGCTP